MAETDTPDAAPAARRRAVALSLAGLVPFVVLTLWLCGIQADHPWHGATIALLKAYAAVVLSFLGGIRWASALRGATDKAPRDLSVSVAPGLAGWVATVLPLPFAFAMLAAAFAAQGAWDAFAAEEPGFPEWFRRLRVWLTPVAVAAMAAAFFATA